MSTGWQPCGAALDGAVPHCFQGAETGDLISWARDARLWEATGIPMIWKVDCWSCGARHLIHPRQSDPGMRRGSLVLGSLCIKTFKNCMCSPPLHMVFWHPSAWGSSWRFQYSPRAKTDNQLIAGSNLETPPESQTGYIMVPALGPTTSWLFS